MTTSDETSLDLCAGVKDNWPKGDWDLDDDGALDERDPNYDSTEEERWKDRKQKERQGASFPSLAHSPMMTSWCVPQWFRTQAASTLTLFLNLNLNQAHSTSVRSQPLQYMLVLAS